MTTLNLVATATADTTGYAKFTFQPAPFGYEYVGSASIPAAPIATGIVPRIDGQMVGSQFYGAQQWGPIVVRSQQTFSLTVRGLTPSWQYQAVWIVTVLPAGTSNATPQPIGPISVLAQKGASLNLTGEGPSTLIANPDPSLAVELHQYAFVSDNPSTTTPGYVEIADLVASIVLNTQAVPISTDLTYNYDFQGQTLPPGHGVYLRAGNTVQVTTGTLNYSLVEVV